VSQGLLGLLRAEVAHALDAAPQQGVDEVVLVGVLDGPGQRLLVLAGQLAHHDLLDQPALVHQAAGQGHHVGRREVRHRQRGQRHCLLGRVQLGLCCFRVR
jgi:hypothetical protein